MERFQDFAFEQAIARDSIWPATDPWFAGAPIPYYVFGHSMVALLERTTGWDPFALFNPAVALVQALFVTGVFGLSWYLGGSPVMGAAGIFLVALMGSPWPVRAIAWASAWRPLDWFGAARAIPDAITEFPMFTILYGDLHAHVLAMPLSVALLTLTCVRVISGHTPGSNLWAALIGGALIATNPLSGVIHLALFALACCRDWRRALAVPLASVALALPFIHPILGSSRDVNFVTTPSPLGPYLAHFGIQLILLELWLLSSTSPPAGTGLVPSPSLRIRRGVTLALPLGGALVGGVRGMLLGFLVSLIHRGWSHRGDPDPRGSVVASLLGGFALLALFACEVGYIEVRYGPSDLARTVTTNKVFLESWILLGVALVAAIGTRNLSKSPLLTIGLALAVAVGTLYPILGSMARTMFFTAPRDLDAARVLRTRRKGDWNAIQWLRQRTRRPVILEAPGDPYTWSGRLATFTGGVCPAAWSYHEASWRHSWDVVKQRIEHVDRMFRGQLPPGTSLEKELDLLGIEYLVIGEPERARYPDTDFAPLLDNFMLVTESVRTRLYERRYGGSHPGAATYD